MGTFSLGLSGIAVTGASYIANGFGLAPEGARGPIADGRLRLPAAGRRSRLGRGPSGRGGPERRGDGAGGVPGPGHRGVGAGVAGDRLSPPATPAPPRSGPAMALAFFAYTGWELLAFTAEEMKEPQARLPARPWQSAWCWWSRSMPAPHLAVQALVPLDDPRLATAPFLAVIKADLRRRPGGCGCWRWRSGGIILANLERGDLGRLAAGVRHRAATASCRAAWALPGYTAPVRHRAARSRPSPWLLIAVSLAWGTGLARPRRPAGHRRPELLSALRRQRRRLREDREARVRDACSAPSPSRSAWCSPASGAGTLIYPAVLFAIPYLFGALARRPAPAGE